MGKFRMWKMLVGVVVLGVVMTSVWAQDPVTLKRQAQSKLLAYRAARADAIRKLAERINGLSITSETTVKDFVAENDRIETSMTAWLSGMKEVGKPSYMEDGTCEVKMEISVEELIVHLKQFHQQYYKGNKIKIRDFEKITATIKEKTLSEIGMGAPRIFESLADSGEASDVTAGSLMSLTHLRGAAKTFWLANVQPQGRLLAVRAARVDGMRRLAERIKGVFITSETRVQDFVAESDQIDVNMQTFLRGARETRIRYHEAELIVEVDIEVNYVTIYTQLKSWGEVHFKGDKVKMKKLEELIVTSKEEVLKETGMGVPREKYLKNKAATITAVMATAAKAPPWMTQSLKAVGNGAINTENPNKAQAKLMAFRAAELDARRKLAEQIQGLMITSETNVRDFVAENDQIQTSMLAFQQGAHVVRGSQKVMEDGTTEATVEIDLKPLWNLIIHWQKTLSISIK